MAKRKVLTQETQLLPEVQLPPELQNVLDKVKDLKEATIKLEDLNAAMNAAKTAIPAHGMTDEQLAEYAKVTGSQPVDLATAVETVIEPKKITETIHPLPDTGVYHTKFDVILRIGNQKFLLDVGISRQIAGFLRTHANAVEINIKKERQQQVKDNMEKAARKCHGGNNGTKAIQSDSK